jgi:dTDP-4-dehydrorhamnose reductase
MKILLFGANGQVGWELQRSLSPLGEVIALGHRDADLAQPVRGHIERHRPDVIVNAAAYTAVDQAETETELAMRVNAGAVAEMAQAAAASGALLVHYSTDYVFDGEKDGVYVESDPTNALSSYGRSKLAGEHAICAEAGCRHLVFRTSWVYAVRGKNFARTILQRARTMDRLQVVADTTGAPTSAELIADVTALALQQCRQEGLVQARPRADADAGLGIFHLVPSGATTWHEYACHLVAQARAAGIALRVEPQAIAPVPASAFPAPARRPRNSRMSNQRLAERFGLTLPDWRLHVNRFVDALAREKS